MSAITILFEEAPTKIHEIDAGEWGFQVGDVTISFTNEAWWDFAEMVRDWLAPEDEAQS